MQPEVIAIALFDIQKLIISVGVSQEDSFEMGQNHFTAC